MLLVSIERMAEIMPGTIMLYLYDNIVDRPIEEISIFQLNKAATFVDKISKTVQF